MNSVQECAGNVYLSVLSTRSVQRLSIMMKSGILANSSNSCADSVPKPVKYLLKHTSPGPQKITFVNSFIELRTLMGLNPFLKWRYIKWLLTGNTPNIRTAFFQTEAGVIFSAHSNSHEIVHLLNFDCCPDWKNCRTDIGSIFSQ